MRLEFHQLDRRWEHLRVRRPERQRRLLASLAGSGQQTPIVVVAVTEQADRYLVIDGYQRIAALQQLGRDTVEAVVWSLSEVEALVLDRSMRWANTRRLWKKAGCWRNWSSASAMGWRSWRAVLIAARVGYRGGWRWSSCFPRACSNRCAAARSRRTWR